MNIIYIYIILGKKKFMSFNWKAAWQKSTFDPDKKWRADGTWAAKSVWFISTLFLQVTIIDTGVRGMIAVGLVPKLYDLDHQPGWLQHSVGFHADDGKYVTSTAD